MITVRMTRAERMISVVVAGMRHAENQNGRATDKQKGDQDPAEIEADGVLAEMAFGKYFGYYPDFTTHPRRGGPDFIRRDGKKVDVKSTRRPHGSLVIILDKDKDEIDWYVLAIVDRDDVHLIGYTTAADAMVEDNIRDLGWGKTYFVDQQDLVQFEGGA